ncbi:MAG: c-type cytochrome [Gemmatimonadota bacterium]|nr:c-type cytochrome [Gemmatimonadota bacterium]
MLRKRSIPLAGIAFVAAMVGAGPAAAQIPEEFTNLEVLPEDISRGELVGIMRGFAGALGVRCNHCHVGEDPADLSTHDFASDEKETKRVARGMMTMLEEINETLIPAAGRSDHERVQCATCHGGIAVPVQLRDVMLRAVEEEGPEAAVAKYRELRERYYGRAAYDFGSGQLNEVAETLAGREAYDEALAIIRLNIEHHPDEAFPNFIEAQVRIRMEDREGAIRALERAVELEPETPFFRSQLERLREPDPER